jgi:hypothetical protein
MIRSIRLIMVYGAHHPLTRFESVDCLGQQGREIKVQFLISQQITNATNGNAGIPAEQGDGQERLVLLYVVYNSAVECLVVNQIVTGSNPVRSPLTFLFLGNIY